MAPSCSIDKPGVADWLVGITETEEDVNAILALIEPTLYDTGQTAHKKLMKLHDDCRNLHLWPSVFGGLGVISNRKTPDHRDFGGCYQWYDILVAAGNYQDAFLDVKDLGTRFQYTPGTAIAICGKLLRHGVPDWVGGERLCYAHYFQGNVMDRLREERPHWVKYQQYYRQMSSGFEKRSKNCLFPTL